MSESRYLPATGRLPLTALYDPVIALTMRERAFRGAVVATALADGTPQAIVDVGCGTGTLAIALADAAPDADVSGVDGDPAVLERARHKAARAHTQVTFVEGRAEALPFRDATFDCVATTLMLHHLDPEPKRAALREVARIGHGEPADTRLSTWIAKARMSLDLDSYREQRDRAQADRVFSDIADAIERGLRALDPRSTDAAVLQRLLETLRRR